MNENTLQLNHAKTFQQQLNLPVQRRRSSSIFKSLSLTVTPERPIKDMIRKLSSEQQIPKTINPFERQDSEVNINYNEIGELKHGILMLSLHKEKPPRFMQDIAGDKISLSTQQTAVRIPSYRFANKKSIPDLTPKFSDEEGVSLFARNNDRSQIIPRPGTLDLSAKSSNGNKQLGSSSLNEAEFTSDKEGQSVGRKMGTEDYINRGPLGTLDLEVPQLQKNKSITSSLPSFLNFSKKPVRKNSIAAVLRQSQIDLINDKSAISDTQMLKRRGSVTPQVRRRDSKRFKTLLEKHNIVRTSIQTDFVKRVIAKMRSQKHSRYERFMQSVKAQYPKLKRIVRHGKEMFKSLMWPLLPTGKFMSIWETIAFIFIMYEMIAVPFEIGFEIDAQDRLLGFEIVKDGFFLVDILLTFHSAYLYMGNMVTDHRMIAKNYLMGWLIPDIIAMIASRWMTVLGFSAQEIRSYNNGQLDSWRYIRITLLLRVLRVGRLKNIVTKIKDSAHSQMVNGIFSLLKLLFYVILIAHWVACTWHFFGMVSDELTGDSWLRQNRLIYESIGERYVASIYWTITTMMTVGYGEITPVTLIERTLNIFTMLLGCGVFGYTMNSIGTLLTQINAEASQRRQTYYIINRFMSRKQLSKETQESVHQYLDYLFESKNEGRREEAAMIGTLSDGIQDQISKEISGRVLKENRVFQVLFGTKFLARLSHCLEEKIYSPNEIIYDETVNQFSLYFIMTGSVDMYFAHTKRTLETLEKGDHFGIVCFFMNCQPVAATKSVNFTSLFFLRKSLFMEVLEDFPTEKETYNLIKDAGNLYKDYSMLKVKCSGCEKEGHDASRCPTLHYMPDKQAIIKEYLDNEKEFCANFQRRNRQEFQVLRKIKYLEKVADVMQLTKPALFKKLSMQTLAPRINVTSTQGSRVAEQPLSIEKIDEDKTLESKVSFTRAKTQIHIGEEKKIVRIRTFDDHRVRSEPVSQKVHSAVVPKTALVFESQSLDNIIQFDMVKNYPIYFPHNNITKIIETMELQEARKNKMEEIKNQIEDLKTIATPSNRIATPSKTVAIPSAALASTPTGYLKVRNRMFLFDETFAQTPSSRTKQTDEPITMGRTRSQSQPQRKKNVTISLHKV